MKLEEFMVGEVVQIPREDYICEAAWGCARKLSAVSC
jgi:hypothetical protein